MEVNYLLAYVGNDTELSLPESYNGENYIIYKYAFPYDESLTNVTIPNRVTSIEDYAFANCITLNAVYYTGTASDWAKITIGSSNTNLTNATRYYYSETQPTASGRYWHYDENGNPTVW